MTSSDTPGVAVTRGKQLRVKIGTWEFGIYAGRQTSQEGES